MSGLSEALKQRRSELGYTLAQVADMVGVTEATVQRWESGNIKALRHGRIAKLAEALQTTPAHLMGWEDQPSAPPVNGDEELTEYLEELRTRPEMKMLFSLTKTATKEDVEKAVKIIEALLGK